ncbi:MAG: lipid IV(A) 3-deoxy-D-manno-octulosonic acid transferase [Gammaproteobacteria bacterium]
MRWIYSAAFLLLLPFILLRLAWRARRNPAYRDRWRQRLGCYDGALRRDEPLWVHAVSVGEVGAAAPLVRALRERYPYAPVLVTTTTPTGYDTVTRQFGESVQHVYFPYDLPWIVRRFLRRFRPRMLLLMETELWPNVIHEARAAGIPVVLVNGRMSEQSARRYRWLRGMTAAMLGALSRIAAQTAADAARLRSLGAPDDRMSITGSLKFDVHLPASVFEEGAAIRRDLGINRPIVMAGSTRPGEEEVLLDMLARLRLRHPTLLLVIAPRHPERFDAVAELCRRAGLVLARRQAGEACRAEVDVYLVDTMGELMKFYAAADVAFVGGSLAPFGGQNVLEPAALGVPIVTGPHLFNFEEIAARLREAEALEIGSDAAALASIVSRWLEDSNRRDAAGRAGSDIVACNKGATTAVVAVLEQAGLR